MLIIVMYYDTVEYQLTETTVRLQKKTVTITYQVVTHYGRNKLSRLNDVAQL